MPRIYNSDSDALDFCSGCFPTLENAHKKHQYEVHELANDERGDCFSYDEEHPPYEDTDYTCEECGCDLTEDDN